MAELVLHKGDDGLHYVEKTVHTIDKATNTKKLVGSFQFIRYQTIKELMDKETPERILATFHASNDIDLQAEYRGNKTSKKADNAAALQSAFADFKAGIITEAAFLDIQRKIVFGK
jgi:hypothetical protein